MNKKHTNDLAVPENDCKAVEIAQKALNPYTSHCWWSAQKLVAGSCCRRSGCCLAKLRFLVGCATWGNPSVKRKHMKSQFDDHSCKYVGGSERYRAMLFFPTVSCSVLQSLCKTRWGSPLYTVSYPQLGVEFHRSLEMNSYQRHYGVMQMCYMAAYVQDVYW